MIDDTVIDSLLQEMNKPGSAGQLAIAPFLSHKHQVAGTSWIDYKDRLVAKGLATSSGSSIMNITDLGRSILGSGGWVAYLAKQADERALQERLAGMKIKKLKWESKLAKWKVWTFWPVFIYGFLGGTAGFIALLSEVELLTLPYLGQPKVEQTIDTTSTLPQTKTADSKATK